MKKTAAVFLLTLLAALAFRAAPDDGSINIVSSSHQDTAWMDTPAFCRRYRIENNIIPALEMMKRNPDYKFTMECMLHLMEFLEAHPERADEIIELTRQGRFEWGATYNQPYESWLSGEELVRQIYYGRRWLKKNFEGCDARVAFTPDVPARALQMQQVLAKSGVPYLLGSRYTKGIYNWESPDGSGIIFYTPGHYINHSLIIGLPAPLAAWGVSRELQRLQPSYRDHQIPPAYCLLNSRDFSVPRDFNPLIKLWNGPRSPGHITPGDPPIMRYACAAQFFDAIAPAQAHLERKMGERPDVWLYIHGPTHHHISDERRRSASALYLAETCSVITGLLDGHLGTWPHAKFDQAWMDQLYIDHGIGGKNGHVTDVVFSRKLREAMELAAPIASSFSEIMGRIKLDAPARAKMVVAFNGGSSSLDMPATVTFPGAAEQGARVLAANGEEIPSQVSMLESSDRINVALSAAGASATASSSAGSDYEAEKAIDGQWEVGETHAELGPSQMWQSKPGLGPHWLVVDLGQPRAIHQVVIRHFGGIGKFRYETKWTTADYRLQAADASDGPWNDLVPAVRGNTLPLTAHSFEPRQVRFLRLYITRGAQAGGDGAARILEVEAFADDSPQGPDILFLARDVPAVGYSAYIVAPGQSDLPADPSIKATNDAAENSFYRVAFEPGGVKSIFDKERGRELLNTDKWLAGEVFTMLSVAPGDRLQGTDAGEFGSMPLPVMDASFDRVANHQPAWTLVESGPVRAVYELTAQLADAEVRQRVTIWHEIKRIDFDADLINFNGRPWREFRMAFPLALDQPEIVYEVPMGVVRIGRDEIAGIGGHAYGLLTYSDEIKTIHPREVQRFIDASDGLGGVSISTSVPVFDWIDPTGLTPYPVIQPVLLASRKSCNGQGNWYPQAGDHHYRFSLTSHPGDWTRGWRARIGGPGEVISTVSQAPSSNNDKDALPASLSFFSLSAPNVMITAIKKAEDDDDVVVRMVEMEGKDTEVTLRTHFLIESAARTDLIEDDPQPIPAADHELTFTIGHHAIETIKLKMRFE